MVCGRAGVRGAGEALGVGWEARWGVDGGAGSGAEVCLRQDGRFRALLLSGQLEMDREATARCVSSPGWADTTRPPPRLPPGQHCKNVLTARLGAHGDTDAPSHSPPRSIAAKPSSGWIYRQGSSHLQSFFASVTHSQSQEPPVHGGLKGIQHSSHSLAPTDRQHPGDTGATNTLHRHGQGGFHPQQTPNPSFPNQEHRAGADVVCGAGGQGNPHPAEAFENMKTKKRRFLEKPQSRGR